MLSVYLIAGEASGDTLGAGLMRSLRAQTAGAVRFSGIGGEKMMAEGLQSLFPYSELSLMGFAEIVPHLLPLLARVQQTVEDIALKHPDIVVTIDSPGFNFRVVKQLRKEHVPSLFVHYVAPTVWAWKPKRAQKCARLFNHMLCLLPFEPPYFEKAGLPATFVGHPAVLRAPGDAQRFRTKYDLAPDRPLLTVMPGSRTGEVDRHMPIFAKALALLEPRVPNLTLAVPTSKRLLPLVGGYFNGCPFRAVLTTEEEDKFDAFAASTAALVKSGTSSLEVAQAGCAQVVAYRTGALSAAIARRVIRVPYVSLVNLLAEKSVIPELLQENCTPEKLAEALLPLLTDPALRAVQQQDSAAALALLHAPEDAAARAVLATLDRPEARR